MNAREQWQALQARLAAAQSFEAAGDRARALGEVDAALKIDPNFLAAHAMRERLNAAPTAPPKELKPPSGPLTHGAAPQTSRTDGYAQFEQRARRRRVDRKIDAARTAIARKRLREAATALDEIIDLDPNLPELTALTAEFDRLRRGAAVSHRGPWLVAAASFAVVVGATWVHHAQPSLVSRPTTALAAGLVETVPAAPVDVAEPTAAAPADAAVPLPETSIPSPIAPEPEPIATAGIRDRESARPPAADRDRPARSVELRAEPPARGVDAAVLEARASAPAPVEVEMPPAPARPDPPAPAPPPQTAPASAVVPVAVVRSASDEQLVKQTLQRYRTAYEGLDATSAHEVYPAVNEAALARAFDGLASQNLTFDACDVQLRGDSASAVCRGTARYVPKVGSREPRTESRLWKFTLRRSGADWTIENARAER